MPESLLFKAVMLRTGSLWRRCTYADRYLYKKKKTHKLQMETFSFAATCFMQRRANNFTRCDEQGNFMPLQCRRLPGEEMMNRISGLGCSCVNVMTGAMIGDRTRVMSRDDIPDCTSRSKHKILQNDKTSNMY